ncbi:MAG: glycosyltransferase [Chthoniobacterales bacterium]
MIRVGFVINSRVPSRDAMRRGMPFYGLWTGWDDRRSPMSFMRFHWVADYLRKSGRADYRLYRPGMALDAVVFLKSMGPECEDLAETLRSQGIATIFEANVDYYTAYDDPEVPMQDLAPRAEQRRAAIVITTGANGVIASSHHLAEVCADFNAKVFAVSDHVNLSLRPRVFGKSPIRDGRLQVWWSGMGSKAFELLVAQAPLEALKDRLHLHLVTDDLSARAAWKPEVRAQFEKFLQNLPHTVHRFHDVRRLLKLYASGGVIISPRTLIAPYNWSHTEWKITLGMACGMPAIASPVPSYRRVGKLAEPGAVTICDSDAAWLEALETHMHPQMLKSSGVAACAVVEEHYSTAQVAPLHADAVNKIIAG